MGYSTEQASASTFASSAPPPPPPPLRSQRPPKDHWTQSLGALFPVSFLILLTSPSMGMKIIGAAAVIGLLYLAATTARRLTSRHRPAQLR